MKLIKLTVVLCFCSSVVLAETTLEIIQQRAEAGDAAAQSVMGLMAFHGYKVPKDSEASQKWYQRAADQGDSFAAGRAIVAKKQAEVSQAGLSGKPSSIASPSKTQLSKQKSLEEKVADASSAEYKGDVRVEELVRNRAEYEGRVVELRVFTRKFCSTVEPPFIYVYDSRDSSVNQRLIVSGHQALEWAVKQSERGFGASCKVYALVEDKNLILLGVHQIQADNGYTYSW